MAVVIRCDPDMLEGLAFHLGAVRTLLEQAEAAFDSGTTADPNTAFGSQMPAQAWAEMRDQTKQACLQTADAINTAIEAVRRTLEAFTSADERLAHAFDGFVPGT
jgi:hypothetical protein